MFKLNEQILRTDSSNIIVNKHSPKVSYQSKTFVEHLDDIVDTFLSIPTKCIHLLKHFFVKKIGSSKKTSLRKKIRHKKSITKRNDITILKKKLQTENISVEKSNDIVNSIENTPPHFLKYIVNAINDK